MAEPAKSINLPPNGYYITLIDGGKIKESRFIPASAGAALLSRPEHRRKKTYRSLEQLWNHDSPLTFGRLADELDRNGLLQDGNLLLNADRIVALSQYLMDRKCIPELSMRELYFAFAGSFTLRFHTPRSLQGLRYPEKYVRFFADRLNFAFNKCEMKNKDESR